MSHRTTWLTLLLPLMFGCGARTVLEERATGGGPPAEELTCGEAPAPRVEDCARASTEAVPVARLRGDGFHLAADAEFLYFNSEDTVFRLPMSGGEPEPLSPPGRGGTEIKYADGFVYWRDGDVVHRVPATGGELEPLVKLPPGASWAVTGDAIVSAGPYEAPSAVYRTSFATGESSELLPEDPEEPIWDLGVGADRVFVARRGSLVSVSTEGGDTQLLHDGGTGGGKPPLAHGGKVYFAGIFPEDDAFAAGILRAELDPPREPEVFVRGYGVAFAVDDDALYAHVIPTPESSGEVTRGRLVRAPLAGGEPVHITDTSSKGHVGFEVASNGLVASGCYLYFLDRCTDIPGGELRLVAIAKTKAR